MARLRGKLEEGGQLTSNGTITYQNEIVGSRGTRSSIRSESI